MTAAPDLSTTLSQLEKLSKITDLFAGGINMLAKLSEQAGGKVSSSMGGASKEAGKLADSFKELSREIRANTNSRSTGAQIAARVEAERNADLTDAINSTRNQLGVAVVDVGKSLLEKSLSLAVKREQDTVSYKVAFGLEGGKMQEAIEKMAKATPFTLDELTPNALALRNFGVQAENIVPTLKMLGDVSGGNGDKLKSLTDAFGGVQQEGKLTEEGFKSLTAAGFNPLETISQQSGISMEVLQKRMGEGRISAEMIATALNLATAEGGNYFNLMSTQSDTVGSKWKNLTDNLAMGLTNAGGYLLPFVNTMLDFTTALFNGDPAAVGLAIALGGIALAINKVNIAQKLWTIAQAAFNVVASMNPLGALLVVIGALVAVFTLFPNATKPVIEVFRTICEWIQNLIGKVLSFFSLGKKEVPKTDAALQTATDTNKTAPPDTVIGKLIAGQSMQSAIGSGAPKNDPLVAHMGTFGAVNPHTGTAGSKGLYAGLNNDLPPTAEKRSENINNGGQRNIVINIAKQIETLEVHALTAQESAEDIAGLVREEMRRVMYSLAAMPAN
jgi:tape measure domain-containing protein